MHELAVCQSIIEQLETIAASHEAARVERVEVAVGPLSGVEPELLRRAFPIASAGSVADGAVLSISSPPVEVECSRCGERSGVRPNRLVCPHCGELRTRLVSGDALLLSRVELEKARPERGPRRPEESEHV